jgi:hypothetical protein
VIAQQPVTSVRLVFYRDRVEHSLRWGRDAGERILDRRRRLIFLAPCVVFAYIRWQANGFGTVLSHIDILRAYGAGEHFATVAACIQAGSPCCGCRAGRARRDCSP